MLAKLAILFLIVMFVMSFFMARPKGREKKIWNPLKRRKTVKESRKCPACGAYVMRGQSCACGG